MVCGSKTDVRSDLDTLGFSEFPERFPFLYVVYCNGVVIHDAFLYDLRPSTRNFQDI